MTKPITQQNNSIIFNFIKNYNRTNIVDYKLNLQKLIISIDKENSNISTIGHCVLDNSSSIKKIIKLPIELIKLWKATKKTPPNELGGIKFYKLIEIYDKEGIKSVQDKLNEFNLSQELIANAYTELARHLRKNNIQKSAEFACKAYEIDPKPYRLKWMAFRIFENGDSISAQIMISLLPKDINMSDWEKKQIEHIYNENRTYEEQDNNIIHKFESQQNIIDIDERIPENELFNILKKYDIVSFDIFDTAILRKVEFPQDIFDIISLKINFPDFQNARKRAEDKARKLKLKQFNTHEVNLAEIYDILNKEFHISKDIYYTEINLEIQNTLKNDYIYNVYKKLIDIGKKIIFTSDMYLPKDIIIKILHKEGFNNYYEIFLSNEYGLSKNNGTLQLKLLEIFRNKKIIHIGDNKKSDVDEFIKCGIESIYYKDCRLKKREAYLNNISGSVYRAILNNNINTGLWKKNIYYTHGFKVGGILTAGYCIYINKICHYNKIDKILFCARDCYIIHKVYNSFYKKYDNEYIEISRYAIMNLSPERYINDLLNRFILKYWEEYKNNITLEQLLKDTGYSYLIQFLNDYDLDKYMFCCNINKEQFINFFISHINTIKTHNSDSIDAAKKYFIDVIGSAKNILIVDIGWSGTCISALEYFIHNNISDNIHIYGSLICASNSKSICNQLLSNNLYSYISGPNKNNDFNNFMMPSNTNNIKEIDLIHMPLEYLFTSTSASLIKYINKGNTYAFIKDKNNSKNQDEIIDMQSGIFDFNKNFYDYIKTIGINIDVSPYVAFISLKESILNKEYCYKIYKNFNYYTITTPGNSKIQRLKFESLFQNKQKSFLEINKKNKIIFVSPELIYTGAPRSLLRTCKIAKELGYYPIIFSSKDGPFKFEFYKNDIEVYIINYNELEDNSIINFIKTCKFAYCNTIVTDKYVKIISKYIPTIWFIREASNILDFCKNNINRLTLLYEYNNIFCVSEYAKKAIQRYTTKDIKILHNSVEDERKYAIDYIPGTAKKVKFAQLGTLEYRKGYDIILAAFNLLPEKYKNQCEIYFAGGFINSGTPYCNYIFPQINHNKSIHYLGNIQDIKSKIRFISNMDVIIIASRDESCSLVALEGAMLSKPLIVTKNVGAKYIINKNNGLIIESNNIEDMKNAMIKMINNKQNLYKMGENAYIAYKKYASIELQKQSLRNLFLECERAKSSNNTINFNSDFDEIPVIISLTSFPKRIKTIHNCINSLINQTYTNKRIILWLSKEQFPNKEKDLPSYLLDFQSSNFEIKWVDDDLKPHKKYFYSCQQFKDIPIITVDDDAIYDQNMVKKLIDSYKKYPKCISCNRANLILFRNNHTFRSYRSWPMNYTLLKDTPSYQLLATGVGGVLFPPNSLPI